MGELKKTTFKEFVTLQRGFDLPKRNMNPGIYPVIGSTSIIGYHDEFKVDPPGVVTGRSGALGSVQYIPVKYWPHNTSLWIKDFKGNFPKYVYYFLQTLGLQYFNSGAAVPTLNRNDLDTLELKIHNLSTQRKIAAVLSVYDDLIENNTRRIEILEEMAGAIYREWFIEFRFPGHEGVEMVESGLGLIPQGWGVVRTEQIIKRVQSGKKYNQKTVEQAGNIPVLDQGQSGIIGYHNDVPGVIASEDEPIIVFANHTCYQRIIQFPFSAIQNVLPFLPHPEKHRNIYWLHWATKDLVELNDYKGHWPEFMSKEFPLPPAALCEQFGEFIKPMVQLTYRLDKRNQNLRQSRELLLPKLISGEIDVSEPDINID